MNRRLNHIFAGLVMGWLFIPMLGAATFFAKAGSLGPDATLVYFIGNPDQFINPKTLSNTLALQFPHLLGYAVVLFGIFHFWNMLVPATDGLRRIFWAAVVVMMVNWGAGFAVIGWGAPWHYIKWAGVWLSLAGLLGLQVLLLHFAFRKKNPA